MLILILIQYFMQCAGKQLNDDSEIVECSNTIEKNGLQILPSLDCQGASSSYDLSNEKSGK